MKSLSKISDYPSALPLLAEDIIEFHASRILLLLYLCGRDGTIDGLTKMAKLDFFVRYPGFFDAACRSLGIDNVSENLNVDTQMIRYHYGPWDQRYYHVLSYLEARSLISVNRDGKTFLLSLTSIGTGIAINLAEDLAFSRLCNHMIRVYEVLGSKNGSTLKKLIYELFDDEIAKLPMQKVIQQ